MCTSGRDAAMLRGRIARAMRAGPALRALNPAFFVLLVACNGLGYEILRMSILQMIVSLEGPRFNS